MAKKNDHAEIKKCGIVMPISAIDGCSKEHWLEVLTIIKEAVVDAKLEAELVSEAEEVGVIAKRIVQNLYDNPLVVCDISAKNPNVMFELGLRLAFDKPTIIIADDQTTVPFDINQIEYLSYPRSLRFSAIVAFKEKLAGKITATLKAAEDPKYTTFLKHFGSFKIAHLDEREVSNQEYLTAQFNEVFKAINSVKRSQIVSHDSALNSPAPLIWHVELGAVPAGQLLHHIRGLRTVTAAMLSSKGGTNELRVVPELAAAGDCVNDVTDRLDSLGVTHSYMPF